MQNQQKRSPLLNHLDEIEELCSKQNPSLQQIIDVFGEEGHYLTLLFMILPFLQPIPLLGLSTPFGILIAVVAYFAYFKKPPVMPKSWGAKTLPAKTVLQIAEASEKVFEKISKIVHPRLPALFKEPFRAISFVLIVINALLMSLPLPVPMSNSLPAWMIAINVLANLEEDGVLVIISYVMSLVSFAFFVGLYFGAETGLHFLKDLL
jgi:hypothetical protein